MFDLSTDSYYDSLQRERDESLFFDPYEESEEEYLYELNEAERRIEKNETSNHTLD